MKRIIAAILAVLILSLCSCAYKNAEKDHAANQPDAAANETAAITENEPEAQPEKAAFPPDALIVDKAGFEFSPEAGLAESDPNGIRELFDSAVDRYGCSFNLEQYYNGKLDSLKEECDLSTVAGALCLVKVKSVTADESPEEEPDQSANFGFRFYETTAEVEIEKVMQSAGSVSESRIREGETLEARTVSRFVYEGDGILAGKIDISFPVTEVGAEYPAIIIDSFGEDEFTYVYVIKVPVSGAEFGEEYQKIYEDVYPSLEDAYNTAKEYLSGLLEGILSDPDLTEKFDGQVFGFSFPAN